MLKKTIAKGITSALRAYIRYTPFQFGKVFLFNRLLTPFFNWRPYEAIIKTTFGAKLAVRFPDVIQMWLFYFGVWEPHLTNFIIRNLKRGDIFVDVGSNIGYFSLLASNLVGNEGKVLAVEASPTIFTLLTQNIERNSCVNIETFNVAAADFHGCLNVYMANEENIGHSTTVASIAEADGHELEATVPAMPLADIVGIERLLKARIIKIDVEGAEVSVISGIRSHLKAFSDCTEWIIEITPDGNEVKAAEITDFLTDFHNAGYYLYRLVNDCDVAACISPGTDYGLTPVPVLENPFDLLASKRIPDRLDDVERAKRLGRTYKDKAVPQNAAELY